jgi:hypothetical protein
MMALANVWAARFVARIDGLHVDFRRQPAAVAKAAEGVVLLPVRQWSRQGSDMTACPLCRAGEA